MKGITNCDLNVRLDRPSVNAPNPFYLPKGTEVTIVDAVLGEEVNRSGNPLWYRLETGGLVWSGGVDGGEPPPMEVNHWIEHFEIDKLWSTNPSIEVGIIDSGFDPGHPDIGVHKATSLLTSGSCDDFDGHGTHCAGILAGTGSKRISGVAKGHKLHVVRAYSSLSSGITSTRLAKAINTLASTNCRVISISVGVPDSPELQAAVAALPPNKILVCAIGNTSAATLLADGEFPARYPNCISVGSLNHGFQLSTFTKPFPQLDICVPGEQIISTNSQLASNSQLYMPRSGTSMATPFVAGLVALILEKYPHYQLSDVRTKLHSLTEIKKRQNLFAYRAIQKKPIII